MLARKAAQVGRPGVAGRMVGRVEPTGGWAMGVGRWADMGRLSAMPGTIK